MDREELKAAINSGPVRIHVCDGREYEIAAPDEALISDAAAHVLNRSQTDGKSKAMILRLDTVSFVEPLSN